MKHAVFPNVEPALAKEIILREEAAYRESIARAVKITLEKDARFVFLAGPSCSGKTTTGKALDEALEAAGKRVVSFSTDDFFFNEERAPLNQDGTPNYDAFEHTDSETILSVLGALSRGEDAQIPIFDFNTGHRSDEVLPISPKDYDVFILEGIHALNDRILEGMPKEEKWVCFYLDVTQGVAMEGQEPLLPTEIRFCRRLIRDYKHRNAGAERTFSLWKNVIHSEKEILHPFRKNADFTINTNFSYEPAVEKKEVTELLAHVLPKSPYYEKAQAIQKKLLSFPSWEEGLIPENSVLQEFID